MAVGVEHRAGAARHRRHASVEVVQIPQGVPPAIFRLDAGSAETRRYGPAYTQVLVLVMYGGSPE